MRRPAAILLAATACLASILTGCANTRSAPTDPELVYAQWAKRTSAALVGRGDAGSLFTAGLLAQTPLPGVVRSDSDALRLIQRAAGAAPSNVVLATSHVAVCLEVPSCDVGTVSGMLKAVDPENAATLLPGLALAVRAKDQVAVERQLELLTQAPRFDTYHNAATLIAAEALKDTQMPSGDRQHRVGSPAEWMIMMSGAYVYQQTGLYLALPDACRGSVPNSPKHSNCLAIFRRMIHSDSQNVQALGAALLGRYGIANPADTRSAQEWRRTFSWRSQQGLGAYESREIGTVFAEYERAVRMHPQEEDSRRAFLIALGLPIDPPAEWSPPQPTSAP